MTKYTTINQMPEEDRPYEKCLRLGAECLTDSELLAVLLRTGTRVALPLKWQKRF